MGARCTTTASRCRGSRAPQCLGTATTTDAGLSDGAKRRKHAARRLANVGNAVLQTLPNKNSAKTFVVLKRLNLPAIIDATGNLMRRIWVKTTWFCEFCNYPTRCTPGTEIQFPKRADLCASPATAKSYSPLETATWQVSHIRVGSGDQNHQENQHILTGRFGPLPEHHGLAGSGDREKSGRGVAILRWYWGGPSAGGPTGGPLRGRAPRCCGRAARRGRSAPP